MQESFWWWQCSVRYSLPTENRDVGLPDHWRSPGAGQRETTLLNDVAATTKWGSRSWTAVFGRFITTERIRQKYFKRWHSGMGNIRAGGRKFLGHWHASITQSQIQNRLIIMTRSIHLILRLCYCINTNNSINIQVLNTLGYRWKRTRSNYILDKTENLQPSLAFLSTLLCSSQFLSFHITNTATVWTYIRNKNF